ncbi:MAG: hypothetical protein K2Q14_01160 [Gammaproteobacteria bacterium]|nr:hypothetical protein [Gammaproteobacteria bacterium]
MFNQRVLDLLRDAGDLNVSDINPAANPAIEDLLAHGLDRRGNRVRAVPFTNAANIFRVTNLPAGIVVGGLQITDGAIVAGGVVPAPAPVAGAVHPIPDHQLLHFSCYYFSNQGVQFNFPRRPNGLAPAALGLTQNPEPEFLQAQPWLQQMLGVVPDFVHGPRVRMLTPEYINNYGTNFIDRVQFGARINFVFQVGGQAVINEAGIAGALNNIPAVNIIEGFYHYMRNHRINIENSHYYISGLRNLPAAVPAVGEHADRARMTQIFNDFLAQARAEDQNPNPAQALETPMRIYYRQWIDVGLHAPAQPVAAPAIGAVVPPAFAAYQAELDLREANDQAGFYLHTIWELGLRILNDQDLNGAQRQELMDRFPQSIRNILFGIRAGSYFTIDVRNSPGRRLNVLGLTGVLANSPHNFLRRSHFRFVPEESGAYFSIYTEEWPNLPLYRHAFPLVHEIMSTGSLPANPHQQHFRLYPRRIIGPDNFIIMLSTRDEPEASCVRAGDGMLDGEQRCRGRTNYAAAQNDIRCHFILTRL